LHLATDWARVRGLMLTVSTAEPLLRNEFRTSPGWAPRPTWRPVTIRDRARKRRPDQ